MNMKLVRVVATVTLGFWLGSVEGNNSDRFNYGTQNERISGGTDFAQKDWDLVTCNNLGQCDGFPNYFEFGKGFSIAGDSNCENCPEGGSQNCGLHRQSPIDLKRDRGVIGNENEKDCPDWHWMAYRDDSCSWEDMATKDTFQIERHALQINMPTLPNGDIDCERNSDGARRWARLDYSKGFPDWWWLSRMDVTVPSQHHQEGKQYAAEITLAHFYEIDHPKNQIGHVTLMMQDYPGVESWPYLDKLLCAWRAKEEQVRSACGLPPVPPYGRCRLYRDQEPTEEWLLEEAGLREAADPDPTSSPTSGPTPAPSTSSPTSAPLTSDPTSSPSTKAPTTESPSSAPITEVPTFVPTTGAPTMSEGLDDLVTTDEPTSGPIENPTSVPTETPTKAPTNIPTEKPSLPPTDVPTETPTEKPSPAPTASLAVALEPIECRDFRVNYNRMCSSGDPCCESQRADTTFCWDLYENYFPGTLINSACSTCCADNDNPEGRQIGPPAPPHPSGLVKNLQCSDLDNPYRMCKENGCCSGTDTSGYCQDLYDLHGDDMNQICWYCCRDPQLFELPTRQRNLRLVSNSTIENPITNTIAHDDAPPADSKVTYVQGKKIILRPENFVEEEEDDEVYFERIHSEFKSRNLQSVVHEEDYEDVRYWPYEWLLKVDTEYYYRYEGTQVVPPCWEIVHWRVMKDPIRVHHRQIAELNRLLASRRDPDTCVRDTAGVVSPDEQTVNVSRDVQYYHPQHRKVFCECKDWPSKFESDRNWCRDWKEDMEYKRFYEYPYNFDTNGVF